MRRIYICTLITLFVSFNCKDKDSTNGGLHISKTGVTIMEKPEPTLPYLDTSITVKAASEINNRNISQNEAERYLYKHFKKRGVINRSDYKADSLLYREIMCVQYDTSYSIKSMTFSGSIICYWLGPSDLLIWPICSA